MKLIIERAKWYRGKGPEFSRLLLHDGMMCCLGFFLRACGVPEAAILDIGDPAGIVIEHDRNIEHLVTKNMPEWLLVTGYSNLAQYEQSENSIDCSILMNKNDAPQLTEDEREAAVKLTFAKHDVEVEFV